MYFSTTLEPITSNDMLPDNAIMERFLRKFNVTIPAKGQSTATLIDSYVDIYGDYFEVKDAHTNSQPRETWDAGLRRKKQVRLLKVGTVDELFPAFSERKINQREFSDDEESFDKEHLTCQDCKDCQSAGGFPTGRYAVRCDLHRDPEREYRHHNITKMTKRSMRRLRTQDVFWTSELSNPKYR